MRNRSIFMLFTLIGLSCVREVRAQSAEHHFDLKAAVSYGLENSLTLRQAVLDQEQAEYQIGEVRSSGLPQITGSGQFQNFPNLPTQLLPGEIVGQPGTQIPVQFGTEYTTSGTLEISQLLYSHEFFTGLKAAKSSRELYALMKIKSEEDVIYQITDAYYQTLQLQEQIKVLDSNMVMLQRLEDLMKVQYENDVVTKTSYSRVKVQKANLSTQLQSLKTGFEQQKNYLKLLMGMPIEEGLILEESPDLQEVSLSSLSFQKENPIDLQILDKQQSLHLLNEKVTKAGYYPTLALFGQQSWQAQRNEFNFFDGDQPWFEQTVIGLQLNVPIFDGRKKHFQIEQIKMDIAKVELQKTNAERQLDMQYDNAQKQLSNSLASVEVQKENKELAREVYDETQLLYKEEVADLTDLLDAEQAYRDAQNNYYNEVLKFRKSELDLLKAQGQLKTLID
ncbi:TolC family protein [Marinoscillum pacificum]|uniref:TolC family protein n=1 Tax=Marinoscillum pacificum TaxID=392723 RepID=UPI00215798AA|nr:TolC family protein [Marinoscillum pacificum]